MPHSAWCRFKREGKLHYLGIFKDVDLAQGIRQEAERMPVSEYPALKASYAKLKKERREGRAGAATDNAPAATNAPGEATDNPPPPGQAEEAPASVPTPSLTDLLADAQKADARAATLKGCLQEAREKYQLAEEQAIQAWNAYAAALRTAVGSSDPFARSAMGAPLDDNGTGLAEER